ncbi:MAG: galactose oxidase early set domain-containing protein [Waterburya sp.]
MANPVSARADTEIIADSVSEFSTTQGENNWYYGFVEDQLLAPFEEMKDYNPSDNSWQVKNYQTKLSAGGGFPNALEPRNNNLAGKQFPVRRWTSEVDGEITITGVLDSKSVAQGGDGVKGYILVNGQRIWSNSARGQPVEYIVKATVKKGDPVDLAIASRRNDAFDDTSFTAKIYGTPLLASAPDAATKGSWETVPLPDNKKDWLHAVHASLLPNGKILIANGSANRNTLVFEDGQAKFLDGVKSNDYDTVNNTLLFDPTTNKFERIDSPPAVQGGDTNDLFCGAQVQMFDGNLLFISGTSRYYPGENFEGSKQSNLYDWKNGTWSTLGKMKEGRWYPSLVPLKDGKIAIFSGLKFGKPSQITPTMEVYDPAKKKFHYVDLTYVEDSPFNTKIEYDEPQYGLKVSAYDGIDIYPRVFPTEDGRILITGDGAGKFPLQIHASKKSYLMTIDEDSNGDITYETVKFDIPPERVELAKVYGSGLLDPNRPGDVMLIGGLIGTNDINLGRSFNPDPDPTVPKVSNSLEHWISPEHSGTPNGKWEIFKDFLNRPRAMNMAVILPNKEVLVINGGEYGEYKPTYEPTLMTFDPSAKGSYKTTEMNPAKLPRLYHNDALLLPDARVLSIGGNPSRAGRQKKDGTVRIDVIPNPPKDAGYGAGYYQIAEVVDKDGNPKSFDVEDYLKDPQNVFLKEDYEAHKAGKLTELLPFIPAEILQAEIFSPPYLFTPGARPAISQAPATLKYGQAGTISVKDATEDSSVVLVGLGSTTHSLDYGQRLAETNITNVALGAESSISFTAPDNANLYPPGYYMMFYVNDSGKPSVAKMVKLEV